MKKAFALLFVLAITVCLAACGTDTPSNGSTTTDGSAQTTTSSIENETTVTTTTTKAVTTTSKTTTTTKATTTTTKPTPTFRNPKTDFKFGKYVAKYFDNNNQSYHVSSLQFYKDFEGVEYYRNNFYTKEYCKKRYQDMGMTFDEQNFSYESEITVNGVTYYSIGDYEMLAEAYKITETEIKVTADFEQWAIFRLNYGDQIILTTTKDDRYAKPNTVFTLTEE